MNDKILEVLFFVYRCSEFLMIGISKLHDIILKASTKCGELGPGFGEKTSSFKSDVVTRAIHVMKALISENEALKVTNQIPSIKNMFFTFVFVLLFFQSQQKQVFVICSAPDKNIVSATSFDPTNVGLSSNFNITQFQSNIAQRIPSITSADISTSNVSTQPNKDLFLDCHVDAKMLDDDFFYGVDYDTLFHTNNDQEWGCVDPQESVPTHAESA